MIKLLIKHTLLDMMISKVFEPLISSFKPNQHKTHWVYDDLIIDSIVAEMSGGDLVFIPMSDVDTVIQLIHDRHGIDVDVDWEECYYFDATRNIAIYIDEEFDFEDYIDRQLNQLDNPI